MREMPTVLVVDDDPDTLYILSEVLAAIGCSTVTARNGIEALEYMARNPLPDLLMTDLSMPLMDGKGLIESLRRRCAAQGVPMVPVIVVTGAWHERDLAPAQGTYECIIYKPFDIQTVMKAAASALRLPPPRHS